LVSFPQSLLEFFRDILASHELQILGVVELIGDLFRQLLLPLIDFLRNLRHEGGRVVDQHPIAAVGTHCLAGLRLLDF